MLKTDIIKKINDLISERKLTKVYLAEELNTSRVTVQSWLEEKTDIPLSSFIKLCELVDLTVSVTEMDGLDKAYYQFKTELLKYRKP